MHIAEVITGGEAGGAQRHVRDLIEHLLERDHRISLIFGGGRWLETVVPKETDIFFEPQLQRAVNWRQDSRVIGHFAQVFKRMQPDLIHLHSSKAGLIGRIAARLAGIPSVYTAHGYVFWDPNLTRIHQKIYRMIEAYGARLGNGVIAVSQRDYDFASKYARHAIYVPNGVDISRNYGFGRPHKVLTVGFMGRLSHEKGLAVFIDAAIRRPQWQWIIAGDGEERALAASAVKKYPQIRWMGWCQNPELFFENIDVFVQPSWKEGLPYTLLEALAHGLPVVATPVGAMGEVLQRVDPRLIMSPGSVEEMLKGLEYAWEHRERLHQKGRLVIQDHYNVARQLQDTEDFLLRIAGGGHT